MNQYKGDYLSQISFPLGGIGSGCIGLAGNGSLVDWELFHHPNRMSINEFSGFAIKAENESEVVDMRVLQGDTCRDFIGGTYGDNDRGWNYGTGVHRGTLAGLKHFRDLTFTGEFPVAELHYADEQFPGEVTMTAFNPFIPGNDKDSSLPAAFMDIEITNTTDQPLSYTAACMVGNPFEAGRAVHQYRKKDDVSMMKITALCQKDDLHYGEFITAADCEDIGYQEYWFRGGWFDNLTMFINDFGSFGPLKNRHYDQPKERHHDVGMLTGRTEIRPGESRHIRFLLSWYVPNAEKYWIAERPAPQWKTYYATIFESAEAVAEYCMKNWERLFEDTQMFRHTLMDSTS